MNNDIVKNLLSYMKIWIYFFQERKASTVSVEVKKSQHKYVIGPKGNSINEILAETGVFVEMPSSESVSETITLRGPQDKLGLGKLRKVFFVCVYLDSSRLFLLNSTTYLNKLFFSNISNYIYLLELFFIIITIYWFVCAKY